MNNFLHAFHHPKPLTQRLAIECKAALMEAADRNTSGGEWLVTDETGDECDTSLMIDEGCLVIELRDCETSEVKHQFRVEIVCEPILG